MIINQNYFEIFKNHQSTAKKTQTNSKNDMNKNAKLTYICN